MQFRYWKSLTLVIFCTFSPHTLSECSLTTFQNGAIASAEEVNCNFEVLQSGILATELELDTTNPSRIVWVAKEGGDYTSLAQAVGQLGNFFSSTNPDPVLIKIAPGVYQEAPTEIELRGVFIEGSGQGATILEYTAGDPGILMTNSRLENGISNLTIRNTAGPAVGISATANTFYDKTESYFRLADVTLEASSSNPVSAFTAAGPIWIEIRGSQISAQATTAGKTVKGISVENAEAFSMYDSEVWANGGFVTTGLYSKDTNLVSVSGSAARVSRSLQFLGTYVANVAIANGIQIEGPVIGAAAHTLQNIQINAASANSSGLGRGIVAANGARIRVMGSEISTSSGPGSLSYGAVAYGVDPSSTNIGSRIDIIGGGVSGDKQCISGCRDVCYLGVVIGDGQLTTAECTGLAAP